MSPTENGMFQTVSDEQLNLIGGSTAFAEHRLFISVPDLIQDQKANRILKELARIIHVTA